MLVQQTLLSVANMEAAKLTILDFPLASRATIDNSWLVDFFLSISIDDNLPNSDLVVIYYASKHIARSVTRRRKRSSYKNLLINSSDAPDIRSVIPDKHKKLFEMANYGGFSSPTEYTFAIATLEAKFYNAMLNGQSTVMQRFLKQRNHQQVFVDDVRKTIRSYDMLQCLLSTRCAQLHCNFELISRSIFNCFAKNKLKMFNAQLSESAPAPKAMRISRKINF